MIAVATAAEGRLWALEEKLTAWRGYPFSADVRAQLFEALAGGEVVQLDAGCGEAGTTSFNGRLRSGIPTSNAISTRYHRVLDRLSAMMPGSVSDELDRNEEAGESSPSKAARRFIRFLAGLQTQLHFNVGYSLASCR